LAGWSGDKAAEEEEDGASSGDVALWNCVHAKGVLAPGIDPGAAEDASFSCYKPGTGFGSALIDARKGFNKLNRYLML
jgi:hypothetical protein